MKFFSRTFLVFFLILLALYLPAKVNAEEINESNDLVEVNNVTEYESQIILEEHFKIAFNLEPNSYNIITDEVVYDVNDEVIANYYEINTILNQQYFIIISSSKEYSAVLASGEGTAEFFPLNQQATKYYFVGGYTLIQADSGNQLIEFVNTKNVNTTFSEVKQELTIQKNPDSLRNWNNLLNQSAESIELYALGNKILNSTIYSQYDSNINSLYRNSACGPTTMAVILQYWHDSRSKTKLKVYGNGYNTKGAFVNYLYVNRGGSYVGMSVNGIVNSLRNEAVDRGYSATTGSFNNFTTYTTEIENSRPVAVKFDSYFTIFEPNADYAYDYHWTPGVGYVYSSSSKLISVQTLGSNSSVKNFDYVTNQPIISMVSLNIQ